MRALTDPEGLPTANLSRRPLLTSELSACDLSQPLTMMPP